MQSMIQDALDYTALEIKHLKINLGHAEKRKGVTEAELDAIRQKISVLEYLQDLVLKEAGR